MSYGILERTRLSEARQDHTLEVRPRNSWWLLALFITIGFSISVAVSMMAGSSPYGVLIVAAVIGACIPLLFLAINAAPEALASARELAQNWTWWHPLWFFIFFSMLVFRIRDVGEAKANPVDAYAMLRILPEGFVFITLIVRLILKKPNWLGALFRGIPGAMAIYCLVCIATT